MSEETTAIFRPDSQPELPQDRFLDRELSWLDFNQRVLELAEDQSLPILERVNYLSIFASNLDEFYMVRVASLKRRIATGMAVQSASGLAPKKVLGLIGDKTRDLQTRHAKLFHDEIAPQLTEKGIHILPFSALTENEQSEIAKYFENQVFPVLTPLAVDPAHPFPYISGLSLNLAVVLKNKESGAEHFARVKVPPLLPRFVEIPNGRPNHFIALEEIMGAFLHVLFPGMEVVEHHTFRVTRNEDLEVDEDEGENLLIQLEKELLRRKFGPPVRLEVADDIAPKVLKLLQKELDIEFYDVHPLPEPLDLRSVSSFAFMDMPTLRFEPHQITTAKQLQDFGEDRNIFDAISEQEILVHHPYESFSTSVQAFLEQAAADPNVLAIKQTLYRTSGDSPIVDALIDAAEAGKQVLALVEIKARFDEQNNITWARKLESAGVHVVYGIVGLKTHCKLSLVIRQEAGQLKRYCHVGTGNYNPKTARYYEDLGLLTAREEVGEDLTRLFNQLSGFAIQSDYKCLLVSPGGVRDGLTEKIQREIEHHKAGKPARIRFKLNSLVDEQIIDQLYFASQAGVQIEILVRGMCALKPGVPGLSETIQVRSVLGRYLEHSRIYAFLNGGEEEIFIGSADIMHRNLDRRVETLVRLVNQDHLRQVNEIFELGLSNQTASWHLDSTGNWKRHHLSPYGAELVDLQDELMSRAIRRNRGFGS